MEPGTCTSVVGGGAVATFRPGEHAVAVDAADCNSHTQLLPRKLEFQGTLELLFQSYSAAVAALVAGVQPPQRR